MNNIKIARKKNRVNDKTINETIKEQKICKKRLNN